MQKLLEKIFNKKIENKMHIFYLLNNRNLFHNIKIIEDPKFNTSSNIVYNNIIHLRKDSFTGLRGSLSLNLTDWILQSPLKNKILIFLSAFSSRLLEIKYEYFYKILYTKNGYIFNFLNNLSGFNYNELIYKIPIKYIINKNKNLYNLFKSIEIYLDNKVLINIKKHFFTQCKKNTLLTIPSPINSIILGINICISNILIDLHFNDFTSLLNIYNQESNLIYLISYYTSDFCIQYKCPKEKILLKNIVLSKKIKFYSI
jgi:hypothetical protein